MSPLCNILKPTVAVAYFAVWFSLPVVAEVANLQPLYERLAQASADEAKGIEREIALERKRSGSVTADFLLKRGVEALERREPDVAIEHFSALIDHAPEVAEGWHGRAQAFFDQGEYGQALSDLSQALNLDPRNYEAIFGLGAIFESLERPRQALAAYRLALKAHPHYKNAAEAVKRLEQGVGAKSL